MKMINSNRLPPAHLAALLFAVLILAARPAHGAGGAPQELSPLMTVATVDGIPITAGELEHELAARPELSEERAAAAENPVVAAALYDQVLSGLIDRILLGNAARKSGVVNPEEIAAQIVSKLMEFESPDHLAKTAAERGISVEEFHLRLKEDLIVDEYLTRAIETPGVTEQELRDFYDELRRTEESNARLKIRYLFAPFEPLMCSAERNFAHRLIESGYEALKSGVEFYDIGDFDRDSTDPLRAGMMLGVRPGRALPEVEERAYKAKLGELVAPFEAERGFFVLRVEDRFVRELPAFKAMRGELEKGLRTKKRGEAVRRHIEKLRAEARIDRPFDNFIVSKLPSQ